MKKILPIVLAIVVALSVAGCGKSTKASDKAVSVGKQAIQVADDYLDGNKDYDEAKDELDELKDDMDYVDELSQDDENKSADFGVQTDLIALSHALLMDDIDNTSETYDKLVDARNSLADDIGVKKR